MDTWTATVGSQRQNPAKSWVCIAGQRHPALFASVLLAVGIVVGDWGAWPIATWAIFTVTGIIAVVMLKSLADRTAWPVLFAGLLLIALGAWRITLENSNRPSPALATLMQSGKTVDVVGHLAGSPEQRAAGWRAPFDLEAIRTERGHIPVTARLLLTTRLSTGEFHSGDLLQFPARIVIPFVQRNPGGFDYAAHLYRQGIDGLLRPSGHIRSLSDAGSRWSLDRYVEPVRRWIRAAIAGALPRPAGGLILGFFLGDTDQLPQSIVNAFRDSGTMHLLAVSGANVWLVVGLLLWPLRIMRVPRWPRTVVLILIVIAFSFLTRNEPSVVRASLMISTMLIGRLLFRPVQFLNAVGVSALTILLVSPSQLFRPGFQLSYVAVIGITLVTQRAQRWEWLPKRGWLRVPLLVLATSTAATLVTVPIVARHFGTVPAWSVPANLCMIPLAAASLYGGLTLAVIAFVPGPLAGWVAIPVQWVVELTSGTAGFFSRLPGARLSWPDPSWIAIIHFYLAVFLLLNWRHRYRWARLVAWYSVALVPAMAIWSLHSQSRPPITLAYLDAGATRVAAYMHQREQGLWLVDSPDLDEGLQEWILVPFARSQSGYSDVPFRLGPWRWLDSSSVSTTDVILLHHESSVPSWKRFVSYSTDAKEPPRVWGEQFAWYGDTIFCLRDYPTSPPGAEWLTQAMASARTIVLPGGLPSRLGATLLARLAPERVILFGGYAQPGHEEQWLERWRAQFPSVQFWSTTLNGGVMIEWRPSSTTIVPTVRDPAP